MAARRSPAATSWIAAEFVALACNLMNTLPVGLIAGSAATAASSPPQVTGALLIGVDLGPNLSVTGSLATILWLVALRRDGQDVKQGRFLRFGVLLTVPPLFLRVGGFVLAPPRRRTKLRPH